MADSSVDQCLAIIRELQNMVAGARTPVMARSSKTQSAHAR